MKSVGKIPHVGTSSHVYEEEARIPNINNIDFSKNTRVELNQSNDEPV